MNSDFLKTLDAFDNGPSSRRDALRKATRIGGNIALAALPFYAMARNTMAKSYGVRFDDDIEILNFALTLEYLEASFYNQGAASGVIDAADAALFTTIQADENAHVAFLTSAIAGAGGTPVVFADEDFDFTAGGDFDPFNDYETFLLLSQAFEDTGVRAYKGQAAEVMDPGILTAALQIHSVEARHAAAVRRLRGSKGWIPFDESPADAVDATYAGEDNTEQGGVELDGLLPYTTEEITEAFDETLTSDEVFAIVDPFVVD